MIAVNHYLVGVATAVVFRNPLVAIPVAFMSHFVLDALPHFGAEFSPVRAKALIVASIIDAGLLIAAIILTWSQYGIWHIVTGVVAFSPDWVWVYRFIVKEKFGALPPPPMNRFNAWHFNIQKFENPWGAGIEILLCVTLMAWLFMSTS